MIWSGYMEHNIRSDSSIETVNSEHLLHENQLLRKVIREKDQEIVNLKHQLELKTKYQGMLEIETYNPPWGK
jgi:hypothetical protein